MTLNAWGERTLADWIKSMAGVIIGENPTSDYPRDAFDGPSGSRASRRLAKRFFPNLNIDVISKEVGLLYKRPAHRAPIRELILFVKQ